MSNTSPAPVISDPRKDYYLVLGLPSGENDAYYALHLPERLALYQQRIHELKEEKGANNTGILYILNAEWQKIMDAYNVLSNPEARHKYDEQRQAMTATFLGSAENDLSSYKGNVYKLKSNKHFRDLIKEFVSAGEKAIGAPKNSITNPNDPKLEAKGFCCKEKSGSPKALFLSFPSEEAENEFIKALQETNTIEDPIKEYDATLGGPESKRPAHDIEEAEPFPAPEVKLSAPEAELNPQLDLEQIQENLQNVIGNLIKGDYNFEFSQEEKELLRDLHFIAHNPQRPLKFENQKELWNLAWRMLCQPKHDAPGFVRQTEEKPEQILTKIREDMGKHCPDLSELKRKNWAEYDANYPATTTEKKESSSYSPRSSMAGK